jgi:hypothetical protein
LSALRRIALVALLLPVTAFAEGPCREARMHGSNLSYLEGCPVDITAVVSRHSTCLYLEAQRKDMPDTGERRALEARLSGYQCETLMCDRVLTLKKYRFQRDIYDVANQAIEHMNTMFDYTAPQVKCVPKDE